MEKDKESVRAEDYLKMLVLERKIDNLMWRKRFKTMPFPCPVKNSGEIDDALQSYMSELNSMRAKALKEIFLQKN
jgi:hypothetical protein